MNGPYGSSPWQTNRPTTQHQNPAVVRHLGQVKFIKVLSWCIADSFFKITDFTPCTFSFKLIQGVVAKGESGFFHGK
jgi:hypothetical protein